jgi:hypothetical protein
MENLVFLAWEKDPASLLQGMVDEQKHLLLTPDSKNIRSFPLTEKINNYIKEHKGVKKIIDFNIFYEYVRTK